MKINIIAVGLSDPGKFVRSRKQNRQEMLTMWCYSETLSYDFSFHKSDKSDCSTW